MYNIFDLRFFKHINPVPHLQFVGKYVTGHKSWSFDNVSSTNSETIKATRSNIKRQSNDKDKYEERDTIRFWNR